MALPASLILAIDAAGQVCSAALWATQADGTSGRLRGSMERQGPTGEAAFLPRMVADLLADNALAATDLMAVAVNVGPGSFTGLRASIAFAQGLALGLGLPVVAVTMAEALRMATVIDDEAKTVWCALDARQGRLFLHRDGTPADWSVAQLAAPPLPTGPLILTGDAATALSAMLTEAGASVTIAEPPPSRAPLVAQAAVLRLTGQLPPLPAVPALYRSAARPSAPGRPAPTTAGMERGSLSDLADTIQTVGPAYAAVLAAIHASAFPNEPWGAAAFQTQLEMHGVIGLLDRRGGLLLLRVAADEAEILTIGVLPNLRRCGLARGLLRTGMAKAAELGATTMFLEVDTDNRAALALYTAAGFSQVGRRKRYYANGADALVLQRNLVPVSSA